MRFYLLLLLAFGLGVAVTYFSNGFGQLTKPTVV